MIPGTEKVPVDEEMRLSRRNSEGEPMAPEVKVEPEPISPDEAFRRYVKVLEKGADSFSEFPPYAVEYERWMEGGGHEHVTLSTHVQNPRAMLKALIVMRSIFEEYEENIAHLAGLQEPEE